MKFEEAKSRVKELRILLEKWSKEYYLNDSPTVDDSLYDKTLLELFSIEKAFPELIKKDSQTQTVGINIEKTLFKKTKHITPMLSLKNAFNEKNLKHFDKQIKEFKNEFNYYIEPKIDGLSISIIYKNGILKNAITRGNGFIGEDVTNNIKQIKNIPHFIENKNNIELRGEIFIPINEFSNINKIRFENQEKLFSNPRNAASGTIRQLNPKIVSERKLDAIIYWAWNIDKNDYMWNSQSETIKELSKLGFQISKESKEAKDILKSIEIINNIHSNKNNLDYEIDGIVIKINNYNLYNKIGNTSKFPKWAIAYKFPAEVKETKLLNIFPTVGRTGRITYNATLEPVEISGTIIRKATLHNADYIRDLDLRIGDQVRIKKAGEIIPKIISVNLNERNQNSKIWKEEKHCPHCNSKLFREKNEVDQYCQNNNCKSKLSESIIHFSSREAMNIEGFSTKQIEKFIDLGWIKNISDIYKLKNRKEEILNIDGYQIKSVESLIKSIEETKKNSLDQLLFGLGIRHIGKKTSKDLAKNFKSIDLIINSSIENLLNQEDLGEIKSKSIINYFSNKENILLLKELKKMGIDPKFKEINIIKNNKFFNSKIVITGSFEEMNRNEVKSFFEEKGAIIMSQISNSTDFLIAGEKSSSNKLNKIDKNKIIKLKNVKDLVV